MKSSDWRPRTYRTEHADLLSFCAAVAETEIRFLCDKDLREEALELVLKCRRSLESYIVVNPVFLTSMVPVPDDKSAPDMVRDMIKYSTVCGVGPMAGVAGAVAQYVVSGLAPRTSEIIAENGGDIFMCSRKERVVAVDFAEGVDPLKIRITPDSMPRGVATSSGRRGHSVSFGLADSVTVTAKSAVLADCAATALANKVTAGGDIPSGLSLAGDIRGIDGVIIVCDGRIGVGGEIEFV